MNKKKYRPNDLSMSSFLCFYYFFREKILGNSIPLNVACLPDWRQVESTTKATSTAAVVNQIDVVYGVSNHAFQKLSYMNSAYIIFLVEDYNLQSTSKLWNFDFNDVIICNSSLAEKVDLQIAIAWLQKNEEDPLL